MAYPPLSADAASKNDLGLAPLGAGDLIDRAVRFYRRNFWTLAAIAAPPVVAGTAVSVAWTFATRSAFGGAGAPSGDLERLSYYLFVWLGSLFIWFTEAALTLSVMGGASRSFVRHLLFGEPVTFRATYQNFLGRAASLIVASALITFILGTPDSSSFISAS